MLYSVSEILKSILKALMSYLNLSYLAIDVLRLVSSECQRLFDQHTNRERLSSTISLCRLRSLSSRFPRVVTCQPPTGLVVYVGPRFGRSSMRRLA